PIIPAGPEITAEFSNQATEATTGVFLQVNTIKHAPASPSFFKQARFLMRRFLLGTAGLDSGGFTLSAETIYGSGQLIEVYDESGHEIPLPARFDWDKVPASVLVNALATGSVMLSFRYDGGPSRQTKPSSSVDEVLVRIGPFPGLAGNPLDRYPFFEY